MSDQQSVSKNYVAIIDIGSNAVRLVVYDGLNRAPFRIHNERTICNLGADLGRTGCLNPDSVKKALNSIRRFSGLLAAMKVSNIRAVATAAVRDAKDGKDFIETVQKEFGLKVAIIDGDEEGRLSALGVMANGFGGSGIIGDYGGGSLELIVVENNKVTHKASLPLGSHRLMAESGRAGRVEMIARHLDRAAFLNDCTGMDFYAMGGAWRSMATAHMYMSQYPLRVLDHYQLEGKKAAEFADLLARQSAASLEKTVGMSKKRLRDIGVAALTMEQLFEKIRPRRLIFSGTGLREGLLYDQLAPALQREDALIAGCAKIALRISRFDDLEAFGTLSRWMEPLFAGQDGAFKRLMEASCLLSDTGWFEHEEYQAEHAFDRILVMPFYGIDHPGRAFLALSQYVRYKGYLRRDHHTRGDEVIRPAQKMLADRTMDLAATIGLAQRMAYLLTGGALGLLNHTELKVTPKQLILKLNDQADLLNADVIHDALKALAENMSLEAVVEG
jgi:exopolyphosphatase/guanosine-5'-triphosphate,3'-diphosphate pyrophosphatase